MRSQVAIWDEFYRSGNPSWKGSPFPLPDLPHGSRVLEVGCGTGSTIIQAVESGYDVTGIDISSTAVSLARERLGKRGIDAVIQVRDLLDFYPDDGGYLGILLHHVLSSMERSQRIEAVTRCIDLLVPGGSISFQDFSVEDMRYGRGEMVEEGTYRKGNGINCHFFTIDEVGKLFSDLERIDLRIGRWTQRTSGGAMERVRVRGIFGKE